ncbi:hypothetical protein ABZV34_09560 [Streptomyces sp. NPDC005195]|uniref:hypothetical protein n=1 Tax=Streptomyces sp. NPDC005195 TaxID=3154561 RepID=UPI0033A3C361
MGVTASGTPATRFEMPGGALEDTGAARLTVTGVAAADPRQAAAKGPYRNDIKSLPGLTTPDGHAPYRTVLP